MNKKNTKKETEFLKICKNTKKQKYELADTDLHHHHHHPHHPHHRRRPHPHHRVF